MSVKQNKEDFLSFFKLDGNVDSDSDSDEDIDEEEFGSENMNEIIPNLLYIGDELAANNTKELKKNNITVIINAAVDAKVKNKKEYEYHQFACFDHPSEKISDFFKQTEDIINKAEMNKKVVLVHCVAGVSRSGAIVISYVMKKMKLKFDKAYDFVKKKRMIVCPNNGFQSQLRKFEKTIFSGKKKKKKK